MCDIEIAASNMHTNSGFLSSTTVLLIILCGTYIVRRVMAVIM